MRDMNRKPLNHKEKPHNSERIMPTLTLLLMPGASALKPAWPAEVEC